MAKTKLKEGDIVFKVCNNEITKLKVNKITPKFARLNSRNEFIHKEYTGVKIAPRYNLDVEYFIFNNETNNQYLRQELQKKQIAERIKELKYKYSFLSYTNKSGYIYILRHKGTNIYNIGYTSNYEQRFESHQSQARIELIEVFCSNKTPFAHGIEQYIFCEFIYNNRLRKSLELFVLNNRQLSKLIDKINITIEEAKLVVEYNKDLFLIK